MIIAILVVLGLCAGSFVNALVWRVHEQAKSKSKAKNKALSILNGRSMCPSCKHELAARDLVPVLSWAWLRGKCRYCRKPISVQYPVVELATAGLFVLSRICWPYALQPQTTSIWPNVIFGLWACLLVGFMALVVYDIRWQLLPNRLVYPLTVGAAAFAGLKLWQYGSSWSHIGQLVLAVALGGGIFYLLFQLSGGKWIGGGDVKLGWLLGLTTATAERSLLLIFLAALGGSVISLPLLASGRLKRNAAIPFGPFLIVAAIAVQLFGADILHWYQQTFINY